VAAWWVFYGPNSFSDPAVRVVTVSRGDTFGRVVDSLDANGIIRSRGQLEFVGRVVGGTRHLQVGRYEFPSGISNMEIIRVLTTGKGNRLIRVTVAEGLRARAQARLFAREIGTDSSRFMVLVFDSSFAQSLGIGASNLEGYLLPETYGFHWQQDEQDVVHTLVSAFRSLFTDSLQERAKELGMTPHQVVTLASIVEGEAVLDEEREIIAGVYHNRLRRGMRLEADPTIQYLLPDSPRRVLYSDLRADNPYNTYRNSGLPPGPVGNPGSRSIMATLYPAVHSYLFFVANGRGGHWFTSTYAEHMRYVRMYRRERARSGGGR
jgi:UPF0755 protein